MTSGHWIRFLPQEEEQNRNPVFSGKLVEEYAGDDNRREYQKVQCHKFCISASRAAPFSL